MSFRGHLPTFLSNYLSNCHFKGRGGTTISDLYTHESAISQGSSLSVTLFSIEIDILHALVFYTIFDLCLLKCFLTIPYYNVSFF